MAKRNLLNIFAKYINSSFWYYTYEVVPVSLHINNTELRSFLEAGNLKCEIHILDAVLYIRPVVHLNLELVVILVNWRKR